MDSSLFQRIGGEATVEAATYRFYDKFIPHPEISKFFDGVPLNVQREKLRSFFTYALGGKSQMPMQKMVEVHKPLLKKGLSRYHFELWLKMMAETLEELSVPEVFIEEFIDYAKPLMDEMFPQSSGKSKF